MTTNTCNCEFCTRHRAIEEVITNGDRMSLIATVRELEAREYYASADLDYYKCIINGSWGSAEEILSRWLTRVLIKDLAFPSPLSPAPRPVPADYATTTERTVPR